MTRGLLGLVVGAWWISALAAPSAALAANGAEPRQAAPAAAVAGELGQARDLMRALADGVQRIQRALPLTSRRPVRAGCVEEKLAEARAGLRIGSQEVERLEASLAAPHGAGARPGDKTAEAAEDRAHALRRLTLLVQRAGELERAAGTCSQDDRGGVDLTEVQVEIAPPGDAPQASRVPSPAGAHTAAR